MCDGLVFLGEEKMIDPNRICMGCMRETGENGICPYCGFSLEEYEKNRSPRVLPARTILNGKYLVGKVIGEGGFGITYLAFDLNLQMRMAIKEYFPAGLVTRDTESGNTESIAFLGQENRNIFQYGLNSFNEEARNLAMFQDLDGIVAVRNFFFENMTGYLVMEYINGKTLKEYLTERDRRYTEKETLQLMKPVLNALAKIHRNGIIHRDISPDNIMLSDNGKIYLIDFGAARAVTGEETRSMTVLLKHGYAPIEQYQTRGKQGPWTDIYAVCATMYRMMSGRIPDAATDRIVRDKVEVLENLRNDRMPLHISSGVSRAIQKGLSIRVEDRYQTVEKLMEDLYRGQSDRQSHRGGAQRKQEERKRRVEEEPPVIRRPSAGTGEKSEKKEMAPVFVAVFLGLVFVGCILGVVWQSGLLRGSSKAVSENTDIMEQDGEDGTPVKTVAKAPEPTATPVPTATPTPAVPTASIVSAEKIDAGEIDLRTNDLVNVIAANASSTIKQTNGVQNYPILLFDDNTQTSWQEGVSGPGIGEYVAAEFDREYEISYMLLRLGNWKDDRYYNGNNRPKGLSFAMGSEVFHLEFPDVHEEFWVEISPPVKTTSFRVTIESVHAGTSWDDTCITDILIYGK